MNFKLTAPYKPTGDQPQAIAGLIKGLNNKQKHQVLLGVTGSGKTYTIAQVIDKVNKPVLVISHNKTLAAQLFQEFRQFFPDNAVCYFVSYYDYYQPEAYLPQTDTYIEKETEINEEIDKLRLAATTNLLTRKDTIIVASVSCIYNLGSPVEYGKHILEVRKDEKIDREAIIARLIDLQYQRSDFGFKRSTFRVRGDNIDIFLAYEEKAIRIRYDLGIIKNITKIDPLTGNVEDELNHYTVFPAKHYLTDVKNRYEIFEGIRRDLDKRTADLRKDNKLVEAQRLSQRVNYDLEMIEEMGFVNGIENYSRYFDGRSPGDPPFTLIDYYKSPYGSDWLLIIDESHMTIPQIRGMYNGDQSRKSTLIEHGFRLPAALDNRPLNFEEFTSRMPQTIYVSATPDSWELNLSKNSVRKSGLTDQSGITEQLIRPTGIIDPEIIIKPTNKMILDLTAEIIKRKKKKERVLVTTLTKRMAEDLAKYLQEKQYLKLSQFSDLKETGLPRVHYLHSDIQTLQRSDILDELRLGNYDCLIGINLLREGLDLPEVSLVVILDADKEGFLRSRTSLIQTMGRAARHIKGQVIMYADTVTNSMQSAISEIERRRIIQNDYNEKNKIKVKGITKPIRDKLVEKTDEEEKIIDPILGKKLSYQALLKVDSGDLTPYDVAKMIRKMEREMRTAAGELNFELAAALRDKINELKTIIK